MQLGARWRVGETPHRGVPPVLHAAIAAQETEHPSAHSWTLTFLEGRPRCALDDLVRVGLDVAGEVVITDLSEGGSPGLAPAGSAADRSAGTASDEDEDDDWLS